MKTLRTCACLLASLALAGCAAAGQGSQAAAHAPVTGRLTGTLAIEGGPLGANGQQPGERPIPGTVIAAGGGHRVVRIRVGGSGRFSAWLPPGRYDVSGESPDIERATTVQVGSSGGPGQELPCSPTVTVTIAARHTSAVTLVCLVP